MKKTLLLLTAYCLLLTAALGQAVVNRDRLSLLRDVGINAGSLTTGQVLRYSGSAWVNTTLGWSMISGTPTTLAGYGITDAQPALPSQSGHSGQFLSTNGSALSWAAAGANFDPHSPGAIGDTTPGTGAFTQTAIVGPTDGTKLFSASDGYGEVKIQFGKMQAPSFYASGQSDLHVLSLGLLGDCVFLRAAANNPAIRNGTNGQTLDIARTFTDASNYSQLAIDVTGSTVAFRADEAGTGVGTLTGYSFDRLVGLGASPAYLLDVQSAVEDLHGGSVRIGNGTVDHRLRVEGTQPYMIGLRNQGGDYVWMGATLSGGYQFSRNTGDALVTFTQGGYVGIGTASPANLLTVTGGDIETTDHGAGLILSSPNGTRYRVSVANDGTLTTTAQ